MYHRHHRRDFRAQTLSNEQGEPIYRPRRARQSVLVSPGYGLAWDHHLQSHFQPVSANVPLDDIDNFFAWARCYRPFVDYFLQFQRVLQTGKLPTDEREARELAVSRLLRIKQEDPPKLGDSVRVFVQEARINFGIVIDQKGGEVERL